MRGFARYLSTLDPDTEVLPHDLLAHSSQRATPYLYSKADFVLKERALARTIPLTSPPGRYQPDEQLLAFLESL